MHAFGLGALQNESMLKCVFLVYRALLWDMLFLLKDEIVTKKFYFMLKKWI